MLRLSSLSRLFSLSYGSTCESFSSLNSPALRACRPKNRQQQQQQLHNTRSTKRAASGRARGRASGPVFHYSEQRHKRKRQLRREFTGLSVLASGGPRKRGSKARADATPVAMARGGDGGGGCEADPVMSTLAACVPRVYRLYVVCSTTTSTIRLLYVYTCVSSGDSRKVYI